MHTDKPKNKLLSSVEEHEKINRTKSSEQLIIIIKGKIAHSNTLSHFTKF